MLGYNRLRKCIQLQNIFFPKQQDGWPLVFSRNRPKIDSSKLAFNPLRIVQGAMLGSIREIALENALKLQIYFLQNQKKFGRKPYG